MRDDERLDRIRVYPRGQMPSWYGEKAAKDPLKESWAKLDCPCCGRYCVVDFFHVEWNSDWCSGYLKQRGNGHLLEGDDKTFKNLMRACRNGAFYFWEDKLKTILPKCHHGYINECILQKVKSAFPDPDDDYEGYPYTLEEYKTLLEEEEDAKIKEHDDEWIPDVPDVPEEESSSSSDSNVYLQWNVNI